MKSMPKTTGADGADSQKASTPVLPWGKKLRRKRKLVLSTQVMSAGWVVGIHERARETLQARGAEQRSRYEQPMGVRGETKREKRKLRSSRRKVKKGLSAIMLRAVDCTRARTQRGCELG